MYILLIYPYKVLGPNQFAVESDHKYKHVDLRHAHRTLYIEHMTTIHT